MDFDKVEADVPFMTHDQEINDFFYTENDIETRPQSFWKYFVPIFMCFILSNILIILITNWAWTRNADSFCALYTSQSWSPVFDDVDIKYTTNAFNGSFFKETIYRQPASPEVDQAWIDLGIDYAGILVPPFEAEKANIALNRAILNETYGGPGYPAIFEVFHQLHCLDIIRKSSYFNYDYYLDIGKGPFGHPETQLKPHVGHCIDTIRQQLMCTADTGLQPFIWVGNPPHPFPDFNRDHKCKNFGAIRDWAEQHQGNFNEKARFHTPLEGELILDEIP